MWTISLQDREQACWEEVIDAPSFTRCPFIVQEYLF